MATLLIRKLDDSLKEMLRKRAAAHGRSMEEEARTILSLELRKVPSSREGLGTRLRRIFVESGAVGELTIPPRSEFPDTFKPLFGDDEDKT
jgi:plasmid stability protein